MLHHIVALFVALSVIHSGTSAITVTSPTKSSVWRADSANVVTWNRVATDPSSFAVAITDHGAETMVLVPKVDSRSLQATIPAGTLPVGEDLQINLVRSAEEPEAILAQSPMFDVISGNGKPAQTHQSPAAVSEGNTFAAAQPLQTLVVPPAFTNAFSPNAMGNMAGMGDQPTQLSNPATGPNTQATQAFSSDGTPFTVAGTSHAVMALESPKLALTALVGTAILIL